MKKQGALWPFVVASLAMAILPLGIVQRIRVTALGTFAPVRNLANAAQDLVARGWERVTPAKHTEEIERQNEFLRSQVVLLLAKNGELAAKLEAATSTRKTVTTDDGELIPADVILSFDSSSFRESLILAAGSQDGIARGMLVLHHGHVIGRIQETGPWTSRVQLSTDSGFKIGAVSLPQIYGSSLTFSQRDVGIFEGSGTETAALKWLKGEAAVEEGAYVVTSGDPLSRIPKGLILGKVTGVTHGRGAYPRVDVTPIVDPQGLEFVLILKMER